MQNGGAAVLGAIAARYVKKTYWPETKLDCVFGLSVITVGANDRVRQGKSTASGQ
jgi:hypothetical protein